MSVRRGRGFFRLGAIAVLWVASAGWIDTRLPRPDPWHDFPDMPFPRSRSVCEATAELELIALAASATLTGRIKMEDAWAAGVRVGYLVAPSVLSYVNGGYSESHWSGANLLDSFTGVPVGAHTHSFNRNGWFVGGGVENNLNIFGITAPGWFMKTEYRLATYDRKNIDPLFDGSNLPASNTNLAFKPLVQTISTSLVYRFNSGGAY